MMLKTNTILRFCFVIGSLLWGLTACAGEPLPPAPTLAPTPTTAPPTGRGAGGVLRILFWQAPTILNPHLASSQKDWAPARVTYEPLASFDKDGNLIPILAAEIPSLQNGGVAPDGKSVTWKLRSDVKWSDGMPFSAADVEFTYDFIANHAVNGATTFTNYQGIVFGEVVSGVNMFKDLGAGLRHMFGGRSQGSEEELMRARNEAIAEMQQRAEAMGAHAVVGVDIDYEVLGADNGMLMVTASGTAVQIARTA